MQVQTTVRLVTLISNDAIWYHFYNLKNMKNTHGGVLLLAKLQAKSCFMSLM